MPAKREPASVAAGRDGLFRVWDPARSVYHGPFDSGAEAADFADALDRRGRPAAKRPQSAPTTLSLESHATRRHTPVQAERPPRGVDPTVPDLHYSPSAGLWYVWSPGDGRYLGPYDSETAAQYRLGELLRPKRATAPKPEQGSLFRGPEPKQRGLFGNPGGVDPRIFRPGTRVVFRPRDVSVYPPSAPPARTIGRTALFPGLRRVYSPDHDTVAVRWDNGREGRALLRDLAVVSGNPSPHRCGMRGCACGNPRKRPAAPPRPRKVPVNVIDVQVRPHGPLSSRELHALQVLSEREARGTLAPRLPPGTPYRCNEPEVGRTVAGRDYGGRILGCMTPPKGRRPLLLVGSSVPLSKLRADAKRRGRLSCPAALAKAQAREAVYGEVLERCPEVEDAVERHAIQSEGRGAPAAPWRGRVKSAVDYCLAHGVNAMTCREEVARQVPDDQFRGAERQRILAAAYRYVQVRYLAAGKKVRAAQGGRREPGVPFDPARFGSGGAEDPRRLPALEGHPRAVAEAEKIRARGIATAREVLRRLADETRGMRAEDVPPRAREMRAAAYAVLSAAQHCRSPRPWPALKATLWSVEGLSYSKNPEGYLRSTFKSFGCPIP